jgi:hypothetical protein
MTPTKGNYALLTELSEVSKDLGYGQFPRSIPRIAAQATSASSRICCHHSTGSAAPPVTTRTHLASGWTWNPRRS